MSAADENAKRCLAQGIQLGNSLVQMEIAIKNKDEEKLGDLAGEFQARAVVSDCVPLENKARVANAAAALESFGRNHDVEGAKQALEMLRREIGFPELAGLAERFQKATPHKTSFGFGKGREVTARFDGYRVVIDGKQELAFVPKEKGPEAFLTFAKLAPSSKVELLPVSKVPPPAAPSKPIALAVAKGPVGMQTERNELITGTGYIERIREGGRVVQIKVFDSKGNLQETIDKGRLESLE